MSELITMFYCLLEWFEVIAVGAGVEMQRNEFAPKLKNKPINAGKDRCRNANQRQTPSQ